MRRGHRLDGNHVEVVKALRSLPAAVLSLAGVGNGCPDVLVNFRGVNTLLEIKDGSKPPSERALTAAEAEFFATWPGGAYIVTTPAEAVAVIVEAARPRKDGSA